MHVAIDKHTLGPVKTIVAPYGPVMTPDGL